MFSRLLKPRNTRTESIGIEIVPDGVAVACVNRSAEGKSVLKSCQYFSDSEAQHRDQWLKDQVQKQHLSGAFCNIVLSSNSYQLLLVDAPKVPAEELRDAMRWKIKDLIHTPVDEVALDIFTLPADSSRGNSGGMVYVVAAKREAIRQAINQVETAGLRVKSIDISEMAWRNLAEYCGDDGRGVAVVKLCQGRGNLVLIRRGNLYLSRQFELAYNAGLLDDLPEENLVLELQRSLDYYERQMGQVPPDKIFLCGENVSEDKVTEGIRAGLAADVSVWSPCDQFIASDSTELGVDKSMFQLCLGAIGGALRHPASLGEQRSQ